MHASKRRAAALSAAGLLLVCALVLDRWCGWVDEGGRMYPARRASIWLQVSNA